MLACTASLSVTHIGADKTWSRFCEVSWTGLADQHCLHTTSLMILIPSEKQQTYCNLQIGSDAALLFLVESCICNLAQRVALM